MATTTAAAAAAAPLGVAATGCHRLLIGADCARRCSWPAKHQTPIGEQEQLAPVRLGRFLKMEAQDRELRLERYKHMSI